MIWPRRIASAHLDSARWTGIACPRRNSSRRVKPLARSSERNASGRLTLAAWTGIACPLRTSSWRAKPLARSVARRIASAHLDSARWTGIVCPRPSDSRRAKRLARPDQGEVENEPRQPSIDALDVSGVLSSTLSNQRGALVGTTTAYQPGRRGFFLVPADSEGNTLRCNVVSGSTQEVAFL